MYEPQHATPAYDLEAQRYYSAHAPAMAAVPAAAAPMHGAPAAAAPAPGGLTGAQWARAVWDLDKHPRLVFLRKVYGTLSAQLLFTLGVICLCLFHDGVRTFVQTHPNVLLIAVFVFLALVIAIACSPQLQRSYPANLGALAVLTLAAAYLLGAVTSFYSTTIVLQAVVLTALITAGLTLYACQTKRDLSWMGGALWILLLVLIGGGLIRLFFPTTPLLDTIWAGFGALVFSGLILYDTWRIMHHVSPDQWVLAALSLYIDIINLFMYLLQFLGAANRQ